MKKMRKKLIACFLVALMMCNALAFGPIQAKAATTYTVTTEAELLAAISNASDGDIINVGSQGEYTYIMFDAPLELTKDLTINMYADTAFNTNSFGEAEALVQIKNCDVTISGNTQFGCGANGIYAYKLIDESDDTSLTIDSSNMLDEGILIVDDESNSYSTQLVINDGSYSIPVDRETAFTFSNGTTTSVVSSENLVINGGEFQENITEYVGENTLILDNGEDAWCRYEVRSTIMSEQFQSMLTDGKVVVPSVVPEYGESDGMAYLLGYLCMYQTEEVEYYPDYISDGVYDITRQVIDTGEVLEKHRVEVVFDADLNEKELAVAETVANNIPYEVEGTWEDENGTIYEDKCSPFLITDMEVVNMWANEYDRNNPVSHIHTVNYSGELKEYLGNSNVDFRVTMIGAGLDTDLYLEACGEAVILMNDVMYAAVHKVVGQVEHIVYVPDGTATDKDSLMAAAQKRINEYLGSDSKVVISYGGAYNTMSNTWWNPDDADYQAEMMDYLGLETAPEHYFIATSGDMQYKFLIMADSSKMVVPSYKTVDAISNVSISSTSSEIPLDTSMRASQLTSGEEYDKVISILDVEENVTYDLKLYSQSTSSYVTELENGTFEVKIPLTDELKGKNLVAYYVDENDKVVEYEVTVEDGYAIFETDHFSIYTIAEGTATVEPSIEVVAPATNVAGSKLEEKPETVIEKVPFTEEEKAQIEAGADVVISLEVKDISETVAKEDKAKVEEAVKEVKDQKVGMYLDINMFKQVGDNQAVKVPELNGKVKIQLTVPDELLVKDTNMEREYSIIRIHDGKAETIEATFDAKTKYLVFETDRFSTYALVYRDVEIVPTTSDNTSVVVWMLLLTVGVGAITFSTKRKQYI